jgi:MtrB/PioB family decaheme-associated outer membrane protein
MRMRLPVFATILLLASAGAVYAQGAEQTTPLVSTKIWANIGFSGTSVTGDSARFNRFGDYRDQGLALDVFGTSQSPDSRVQFGATHMGYNDQRYFATFSGMGKVKGSVSFTQIPLNYGFKSDGYVQTPYDGDYQLDFATRSAVQAGDGVAVPGNPAQRTSFLPFYHAIDVKSLRSTFEGKFAFSPVKDLSLTFNVNTFTRQGSQPWGASFGFSQAVEIARPVNDRNTTVSGDLEWSREKGVFSLGYEHSQFDSQVEQLVWDSPYRITDTTSSTAYITGNGTTQGRLTLPPSSTEETFRAAAVGRLPRRTTISANMAVATLKQDGTIIPFTINSAIPVIPLDRDHAEAKVDVATFGFGLNSRPAPKVWLTARYRYMNHENKTPAFNGEEYVRFDQVLEETGGETDQLNVKQNSFMAGVSYAPMPHAAVRVDYGRNQVDRTHREFATTTENSVKFSVDSVGSGMFTLRSSYLFAKRTGSGFDEEILVDAGQQPEMRHYDVANRDRNRGTVTFSATPNDQVALSVSIAAGQDTYPDQEFGLLDNKNQAYTFGVDVYPNETAIFSVLYAYEKYNHRMKSRNASPGATFVDPAYDWFDDADEKLNTFVVSLDLVKAIQKTDVRFAYDYSKSDANFKYSGPNITRLSGLGQFEQLPTNMNRFDRATADVRYYINEKVALNFAYWFDRFQVEDFTVPEPAPGETAPRVDPQGLLSLGYFTRPYTANTGFFRVIVFFN